VSGHESFDETAVGTARAPSHTLLACDPNTLLITFADPVLERVLDFAPGTLIGGPVSRLVQPRNQSSIEYDIASFTSRAAHDLVGPLNQAGSLAALLVKRYRGQLDPGAEVILGHLQGAANRMASMVEEVRTYLSMLTREASLVLVDSNNALTSALFLLHSDIEQSGAIVTADSLPEVLGDSNQLTMLFSKLISNSIKFRNASAPPQVHVSCVLSSQEVVFSVRDNGIGIPPQHCSTVFLAFKTLHGREYPGTGLGLTIAKRIVESHRGRIWIESEEGHGTAVYFTMHSYPDQ